MVRSCSILIDRGTVSPGDAILWGLRAVRSQACGASLTSDVLGSIGCYVLWKDGEETKHSDAIWQPCPLWVSAVITWRATWSLGSYCGPSHIPGPKWNCYKSKRLSVESSALSSVSLLGDFACLLAQSCEITISKQKCSVPAASTLTIQPAVG